MTDEFARWQGNDTASPTAVLKPPRGLSTLLIIFYAMNDLIKSSAHGWLRYTIVSIGSPCGVRVGDPGLGVGDAIGGTDLRPP